MCDEDDGLAEAAREGAEFTLKLGAGDGVEGAEGFVHQENWRIGGEGAGDADALALAAGKFARATLRVFAWIEADELEHFFDAGGDARGGPAFQRRDEGDVFRHGEMGEEAGVLNDVPDAAAEADGVPLRSGAVLNENFALGRKQDSVNQFEEGGLAAAAATEEDERLTLWNCEGNPRNDASHRNIVYVKCDVAEFDQIWRSIHGFRIHFD